MFVMAGTFLCNDSLNLRKVAEVPLARLELAHTAPEAAALIH